MGEVLPFEQGPNLDNFKKGFFVVCRSIKDNELLMRDSISFHLFMWMMVEASYENRQQWKKTGNGKILIDIKVGQLLFGIKSASQATDISEKSLRNRIKLFEKEKIITVKRAHQYSLITICNYNPYQDFESYKGTARVVARGVAHNYKESKHNKL